MKSGEKGCFRCHTCGALFDVVLLIAGSTLAPKCDHKFIDSVSCVKCGWTPGQTVKACPFCADDQALDAVPDNQPAPHIKAS
jgi:hypothetical protein